MSFDDKLDSKLETLNKRISDGEVKMGATQAQVSTIFVAIKDLKDAVLSVGKSIDSIKGDIHVISQNFVKIDELKELHIRIERLENYKTWVLGSMATVGFFSTMILAILQVMK